MKQQWYHCRRREQPGRPLLPAVVLKFLLLAAALLLSTTWKQQQQQQQPLLVSAWITQSATHRTTTVTTKRRYTTANAVVRNNHDDDDDDDDEHLDPVLLLLPSNPCRGNNTITRRRQFLMESFVSTSFLSILMMLNSPSESHARNLPESNGADTSQTGTVRALVPIVELRNNLQAALQEQEMSGMRTLTLQVPPSFSAISSSIPTKEQDFKRLFDAYSDQVSYKQKFLDQNAFLVYYTQGFDGPGRQPIENSGDGRVVNERQTLQFGARNEAWVAWDNFLAEREYYCQTIDNGNNDQQQEDFAELLKGLTDTIRAVDAYLKLSPPEDVTAANNMVAASSKRSKQ